MRISGFLLNHLFLAYCQNSLNRSQRNKTSLKCEISRVTLLMFTSPPTGLSIFTCITAGKITVDPIKHPHQAINDNSQTHYHFNSFSQPLNMVSVRKYLPSILMEKLSVDLHYYFTLNYILETRDIVLHHYWNKRSNNVSIHLLTYSFGH